MWMTEQKFPSLEPRINGSNGNDNGLAAIPSTGERADPAVPISKKRSFLLIFPGNISVRFSGMPGTLQMDGDQKSTAGNPALFHIFQRSSTIVYGTRRNITDRFRFRGFEGKLFSPVTQSFGNLLPHFQDFIFQFFDPFIGHAHRRPRYAHG